MFFLVFLSWKSTHHQQAVWEMGGYLCGGVCVCVCVCFVRGGGGGVCGGGFSYMYMKGGKNRERGHFFCFVVEYV